MYRKSMLLVLSLILIFSIATALTACGQPQEDQQVEGQTEAPVVEEAKQLLIYTSMYPLYDFAKRLLEIRQRLSILYLRVQSHMILSLLQEILLT